MGIQLLMKLLHLSKLPVVAIGKVLDDIFTSKEEKLTHTEVMTRIQQEPGKLQAEINAIEAQHRSVFVAGWRPFIGWVCGINIVYLVCVREWFIWGLTLVGSDIVIPPAMGMDMTVELVVVLLGLGGLRTVEKLNGRAK